MAKRRGPTPARVTIRDVAEAAGVSTATVSYVLNDVQGQQISAPTRQRVREAAATLGYIPHGVARALREGTSRIVLLNLGNLIGGAGLDTFIAGMSSELRALGHTLLVTAPDGGPHESVPAEVLAALTPRAVIDVARFAAEATASDPVSRAIQGYSDGLASHTLAQLTYLAEQGHRRIAVAVPRREDDVFAESRILQMQAGADALGLVVTRVVRTDPGEDGSQVSAQIVELIERDQVSAVAAYSDHVALVILAGLGRTSYSAPGDLAVIGLGDQESGALWQPALTTVRIDSAGYGRRAARVALGLEPGDWDRPPSWVVVRASA